MFLVSLNADSSRDSNVFRKVGGRHGMVFGYVSPKAIHLPPLVPGTVLRLGLVCLLDVNEEEVDCCPSVLRDLSVHWCMLPVILASVFCSSGVVDEYFVCGSIYF